MYIKPFEEAYREDIRAIHMATASEHARSDRAHGEFSLLMYCDEYLDHETAFMAMDENDERPKGYVLCAKDAKTWAENMQSYGEKIEALGEPYITRFREGLKEYDLAYEMYPAHLHIDILEEYTGKHLGSLLMKTLFEYLRKENVKGICLGVARANERAAGFYKAMGFEILAESEGGWFMGKKLL